MSRRGKTILRVYPRVCGGTLVLAHTDLGIVGLSPRVRGNPDGQMLDVQVKRSIPACAGEPPETYPEADVAPVYPRVCGGTRG